MECMNMPPPDLTPRQSSTSCDVESISTQPSEDLPPQQSTSCDVVTKNIPPPEDLTPQQNTSCDVESLNIPPPEQSPPQQRSRAWPPRLDTSFQPAGHSSASNKETQRVDPIGHQPKPKRAMPRGKDFRNDQLLEAMSVPVQSDKALQMMFSMGWTGGALGARGSGITEPIVPYLNGGSGAGFGHEIPIKNNNKLPKGITPIAIPSVTPRILAAMSSSHRPGYIFRKIFLTHLLDLLTSTDNSKTLKLYPNINKKEISFVNHTIRNLAARARVKLDDDGQSMVDNIELIYRKDPEMLVTACVHNDKKHLVLTKRHGLGKMCHSEEARNQRLAMAEDISENISHFMIHYGPMVYTQKSYDELKFKVLYLLEVLKLVRDNTLSHLVVDMVMTLREKNLLRQGLNSFNKNKNVRQKTPETILFWRIRKFIGCYTVNVKFTKEYTQFTLYKEYLVPSMVAGAHLTYEYAEMQGQINKDTESKWLDSVSLLIDDDDDEINVENKNDNMEPDESNIEFEQKTVTTETNEIDEIVKTLTI
ncbi:unnamed protein product [Arctia plantaginis]|uniref:G-patch domain-containing protein n=1 Tax=Arctia plantaginis TaxID=874455 RepID=A0A8S1BH79_ARCPL|nr:unnamed protein product [Arctia plantaginis]